MNLEYKDKYLKYKKKYTELKKQTAGKNYMPNLPKLSMPKLPKLSRPKYVSAIKEEDLSDETCNNYQKMTQAPKKSIGYANTNWNNCKEWKEIYEQFTKFDNNINKLYSDLESIKSEDFFISKKKSDKNFNIDENLEIIQEDKIRKFKDEFKKYKKELEEGKEVIKKNINKYNKKEFKKYKKELEEGKEVIKFNINKYNKKVENIKEEIDEKITNFYKLLQTKKEGVKIFEQKERDEKFDFCTTLKKSLEQYTNPEEHKKKYDEKINHFNKGGTFYFNFSFFNDIKKNDKNRYLYKDKKDITEQINNCKYKDVLSDYLKYKRDAVEKKWSVDEWKNKIKNEQQTIYALQQFYGLNLDYIENSKKLDDKGKEEVKNYFIQKQNNIKKENNKQFYAKQRKKAQDELNQLNAEQKVRKMYQNPTSGKTLQKNLEKELGFKFEQ